MCLSSSDLRKRPTVIPTSSPAANSSAWPLRVLINNPSTIIADEPTGNLDPARSLEIMRLLERINQLGTTMVVVTHEKDLVNQFKKRVVTLEQGVITSDGNGVGYNAR